MKLLCVVLVTLLSVSIVLAQVGTGDISPLIGNKAFVDKQIKCVLDKGPCDRTGKQIKSGIPEVLQRNCRSCNKAQASNARKLISFLQKNYPDAWKQVQAKYKA